MVKRNIFAFAIILVFLAAGYLYVYTQRSFYEAEASAQWIDPAADWLRAVKSVTAPEVMEGVVMELGLESKDSAVLKIQEKILQLQKSIQVSADENARLVRIRVRNRKPAMAVDIANHTLQVLQRVTLDQQKEKARTQEEFLSRKIKMDAEKLPVLEKQLKDLRQDNRTKSQGRDKIQSQLDDRDDVRKELLETYTEKHPGIVEIDGEVKDLQAQLRALPVPDRLKEEQLEKEFTELDREYRQAREAYDNAGLREAAAVEQIRILSLAGKPEKKIPAESQPLFVLFLLAGAVAAFFLLFRRKV